jgi:Kyakuja-Dileera-Zisupton transposase
VSFSCLIQTVHLYFSGGDIHVAIDGNFHHRHLASSGDTSHFYAAKHFIPKSEVDIVGKRIDKARKANPKALLPKVPDEAIDACKESYHAAKGDQQNAGTRRCDVNGLMALVCRHDIPIFFTDIDTPGEQQKYAVALIERLFSLLPPSATVVVLYDIGCVLDRSLQTVCTSSA